MLWSRRGPDSSIQGRCHASSSTARGACRRCFDDRRGRGRTGFRRHGGHIDLGLHGERRIERHAEQPGHDRRGKREMHRQRRDGDGERLRAPPSRSYLTAARSRRAGRDGQSDGDLRPGDVHIHGQRCPTAARDRRPADVDLPRHGHLGGASTSARRRSATPPSPATRTSASRRSSRTRTTLATVRAATRRRARRIHVPASGVLSSVMARRSLTSPALLAVLALVARRLRRRQRRRRLDRGERAAHRPVADDPRPRHRHDARRQRRAPSTRETSRSCAPGPRRSSAATSNGAARFFALPSAVANGTRPIALETRAQARAFNRSLPCGADVDLRSRRARRLLRRHVPA